MNTFQNNRHIKNFLVVSLIFFVLMVLAFCFTGYEVSIHSTLQFDADVFSWLQSIRSSFITSLMIAVTFFGSRYFLFPCYTILVVHYVFIRKNFWFAVAIAFTGFAGNQLLYLMQHLFHRVRPSNPLISNVTGYGYPSGHSFASFVFAGLLSYLLWQTRLHAKWKFILMVIFFLFAATIAISRAYLHVHYPTDVLGGFYLSMLWMVPCLWILFLIDRKYVER